MKKTISLILILLTVLSLQACTAADFPDPFTDTDHIDTVADIFTEIVTERSENPDNSENTEDTEPPLIEKDTWGFHSMGFHNFQNDEKGRYCTYTGGEMMFEFSIKLKGTSKTSGMGVMLFIDGMLQPYKTNENGEYKYMHTFDPEEGVETIYQFTFTPVTGKEGDKLEIQAVTMLDPYFYRGRDEEICMVQTSSLSTATSPMYFEATPDTVTMPEVNERVISKTIEYVDLTSDEVKYWSGENYRNTISFDGILNGHTNLFSPFIYGIKAEDELHYQFELYGNTTPLFSVWIFVNNEPISVLPENKIFISNKNGKKVVVDVTFDNSDFTGETVVYALLIPRNAWDLRGEIDVGVSATRTLYLTDAENGTALLDKYGLEE